MLCFSYLYFHEFLARNPIQKTTITQNDINILVETSSLGTGDESESLHNILKHYTEVLNHPV
jgi:hypothetical protein